MLNFFTKRHPGGRGGREENYLKSVGGREEKSKFRISESLEGGGGARQLVFLRSLEEKKEGAGVRGDAGAPETRLQQHRDVAH